MAAARKNASACRAASGLACRSRTMASSRSEVVVGLARQSALLQGHGFNDNGGGTQKRLCLPGGIRPRLPFEDHGEFQMAHDTEAADVRRQDQACKVLGLRLLKKYCDQRGSIENHFGSPCSS